MLRRGDELVIGQPAHAWVSGQLARAWGNDAFPAPSPREPVCLATEQHDVGWADADLAPLLDDAGRPRSFLDVPRPAHLGIWRGAAHRLIAQSRYAALLVSLHGTSLYERWVDPDAHPPDVAEAIRDYLTGQRGLQAELAAGLDAEEVDRNRRLLLALDHLSLALCHGRDAEIADVPGAGGALTLRVALADTAPIAAGARDDRAVPGDVPATGVTVAPWPFAAAAVVVGCEARRLPGTFADAYAAAAALEAAPWVPLRWALSPG